MYGGNTIIRISRLQNGFSVSLNDPEIVKKNRERDNSSKGAVCVPYRDPEVTYAFNNPNADAAVAKFISENISKVLPEDEYSSTFDKAAKEAQDSD